MQGELSQWLGQLASALPFGYAFGAGMVSAVNPCGFAMLPVYLTLYLGANEERFAQRSLGYRLMMAAMVAGLVTAGVGLLFGGVGAVVALGGSFLMESAPWFALVVGFALVALGLWMLMGKSVSMPQAISWAQKIGDPRDISPFGFFLFGVAFGATSLGCTLPIFLMVMGSSLAAGNFALGLWQMGSYVLGMGSVLLALTIAIALVKKGVVDSFRRAMPYVQKASAVLVLVAGVYIVYYWLTSGMLGQA